MGGRNGEEGSRERAPRELELAQLVAEYVDLQTEGALDAEKFKAGHPDLSPLLKGEFGAFDEFWSWIDDEEDGERLPRDLGSFRLLSVLGQGGEGVVYKALETSLARRVALKVLSPRHLTNTSAAKRFQREAKIAASLNHPSIVKIHSFGREGETPYYAMELVLGETLKQVLERTSSADFRSSRLKLDPSKVDLKSSSCLALLLEREKPPSPLSSDTKTEDRDSSIEAPANGSPPLPRIQVPPAADASFFRTMANAFANLADGLHYAHSRGIVHRDLKPSNIIFDVEGQLRLLDFGLACVVDGESLTSTNRVAGTLGYMSPEQARGRPLDGRSDVYSLGVTLYEALTWRRPFEGTAVLEKIIRNDPPPPRKLNPLIPRDLESIIGKCLQKDPRARYRTAEALAQDCRRFVRGDPVEARPQPILLAVARRAWRSRVRLSAASIVLACSLWLLLSLLGHARTTRLAAFESSVRSGLAWIYEEAARRYSRDSGPVRHEALLSPAPLEGDLLSRFGEVAEKLLIAVRPESEASRSSPDFEQDPTAEAMRNLENAIRTYPSRPEPQYHMARALLAWGKVKEAQARLDLALALEPGFFPARTLKSLIKGPGISDESTTRSSALRGTDESWKRLWAQSKAALIRRDWKDASDLLEDFGTPFEGAMEYYLGSREEILFDRALANLNVGDTKRARRDLSAAISRIANPYPPGIELERGKLLSLEGKQEEAAKLFDLAFGSIAPQFRDGIAHRVAASYFEIGDFTKALEWSNRLSSDVMKRRFELKVTWDQLRRRRDPSKEEVNRFLILKDRVAKDTQDVESRLELGEILLVQASAEKDKARAKAALDEADSTLSDARRLHPEDPRLLVAHGLLLEEKGQLPEAETLMRQASRLDGGSARVRLHLGRLLLRQGREGEAEASYLEARRLDPDDPFVLNNLGTILDARGEADSARELYREATRSAPKLSLAHYNLAWALQRQWRFDEAEDEYLRAVQLGLNQDAGLHLNLAACHQQTGQLNEAMAEYTNALTINQRHAPTHRGLGTAFEWLASTVERKLGNYFLEEARDSYRTASTLEPDWADAHQRLASMLGRLGLTNYNEALLEFQKAQDLDPTSVSISNDLASLILRMRRPPPVSAELQLAIPRFEDLALQSGDSPVIEWLLDAYRLAFLPDLASFASIDRLIDGPEILIPDGALWRFFRGRSSPSSGLEWTQLDFDDSGWETGHTPFAYPEELGPATLLDDMKDNYTSVYLRLRFKFNRPDRARVLNLLVRVDDGMVAYLNGQEIGRVKAGEAKSLLPNDAGADDYETSPWAAARFSIYPSLLKEENVLAVQGINQSIDNNDFALSPVLKVEVAFDETEKRRLLDQFQAFEAGSHGPSARFFTAYFRGRLAEKEGDLENAVTLFREAAILTPPRPEPPLRVSACLARLGNVQAAAAELRQTIESVLPQEKKLWKEWFHQSLVEDKLTPAQALAALPEPTNTESSEREDIRWLLEELSAGRPLRIACGSLGYRKSDGTMWRRDCFYRGGISTFIGAPHRLGTERGSRPLYHTARYFPNPGPRLPGYSIPLPPGSYRVTLHFMEGHFRESGKRRFDVFFEARKVLEDNDLADQGFRVPLVKAFDDIKVEDGSLDISFFRRMDCPQLAAIEVEKR
jgi:serine/threonine protein kinase/tetratricopeptide (TPR) repeat protein